MNVSDAVTDSPMISPAKSGRSPLVNRNGHNSQHEEGRSHGFYENALPVPDAGEQRRCTQPDVHGAHADAQRRQEARDGCACELRYEIRYHLTSGKLSHRPQGNRDRGVEMRPRYASDA